MGGQAPLAELSSRYKGTSQKVSPWMFLDAATPPGAPGDKGFWTVRQNNGPKWRKRSQISAALLSSGRVSRGWVQSLEKQQLMIMRSPHTYLYLFYGVQSICCIANGSRTPDRLRNDQARRQVARGELRRGMRHGFSAARPKSLLLLLSTLL